MTVSGRVLEVINEQGQDVTVTTYGTNTYTVATGVNARTGTSVTVRAFVRNYAGAELAGLIKQGDKEVIIPADALATAPALEDKVTIGSVTYNIEGVDLRVVRNAPALYLLQVRG